MHKNVAIHKELQELGSKLTELSPVNVFSVPDGYFDTLTPELLLYIQQHTTSTPDITQDVPEAYFDGLAESIMNRIRTENKSDTDESFINPVKHINVYTTPEGYFGSLSDNILEKINSSTLNNTDDSLIYTVKHINVYQVPEGYFNTVSDSVMNKIGVPSKVVKMTGRFVFARYAIAAAITGIIGFSLFTFLNHNSGTGKLTPETASLMKAASQINQTGSFDSEMASIGDEAIVQYLEANGQDVNAALVASVADDKTLPGEDDYLYNDNTLDDLLNELNISTINSKTN
jgi:hypothetical protein